MKNNNLNTQELAAELSHALYTDKRNNGDSFVRLVDNHPSWMTEVCHEAHGDSMPDDTIYEFIERAASAIADWDDEDSLEDAINEIEPDCYTSDLTAWLHASVSNVDYLTEVLEEFGTFDDGFQLLAAAQKLHIEEVGNALLHALETAYTDEGDRFYVWENSIEGPDRMVWLDSGDLDYDWQADANGYPVFA